MEQHLFSLKFWLLVLSFDFRCAHADQDTVNYLSKHLKITYDVISNFENSWMTFDGELTFENTGSEMISNGGTWSLYFCHIRLLQPEDINDGGSELGDTGLKVFHINGCMHRIDPNASFAGIESGAMLKIPFRADFWQIARTDIMPNWYIAAPDTDPRVVESTAGESLDFVGMFDSKEKWKRITDDMYDPYTAGDRFTMNNYADKGSSQAFVIPTPLEEMLDPDTTLNIGTGNWVVVPMDGTLDQEAEYLADKLGISVVDASLAPSSHYISICANDTLNESPEYYKIEIDASTDIVTIMGSGRPGVFYGVQTLLSLKDGSDEIPVGSITDSPRFDYRGMHVDVGRNFHSKEAILRLLEAMAMYKLNKLHLHLTDDEGWRLEIPGLPELTSVGGRRCHDETGDMCIMPQLGSGPLLTNAGTGYYTVDDYKEILTFANMRHIEVIPEFDMPGHAHAAIHAMFARYRNLMGTDLDAAQEFLLSEMDDSSEYLSVQYFTDNAINPCLNSTYNFVRHLVKEVKAMHEGIQPLATFNFGGDEVPEGAWINSTTCQEMGLHTSEEIKEMFIMEIAEIAFGEGLDLSGWEDGFTKNATELFGTMELATTNEYSYIWNNVWEWGGAENAYVFANSNYKVILSHATHLYFDHPYEPDPEERGFYWATRIVPTRKTFGYMPDSVYDNIDVDRMGNTLDKDEICGECAELEDDKRSNILGIQGQLWSETVRTSDQLEYMIFPRLLALAERAWHKAAWEDIEDASQREAAKALDWEKFANTLGYKELARLDKLGVQYALSPPGVRVTADFKLEVKPEYPGLPVQYSMDGGQRWADYDPSREFDSGTLHVITRSANRGRISRSSVVQVQVPTTSEGNPVSVNLAQMMLMTVLAIMFTL